jgi:uncharacterized membrane protein (DUF106 family)
MINVCMITKKSLVLFIFQSVIYDRKRHSYLCNVRQWLYIVLVIIIIIIITIITTIIITIIITIINLPTVEFLNLKHTKKKFNFVGIVNFVRLTCLVIIN